MTDETPKKSLIELVDDCVLMYEAFDALKDETLRAIPLIRRDSAIQ